MNTQRIAAALLILASTSQLAHATTVTKLTSASQLSAQDTAFVDKDQAGTTYAGPSVTFNNGNDRLTFSRRIGQYETDVAGYNYGNSAFANGTKLVGAGGFQGSGDGGPVKLTFSTPVNEFGLNVEDFDLAGAGGGTYTIDFTAYDASGVSLGMYSANGCGNNSCLSFEGLAVTGDTISSISFSDVTAGSFNNLLFGNIAYGFTTSPAPSVTPEPSSLLLLGTGIVGVMGLVRRRFRL